MSLIEKNYLVETSALCKNEMILKEGSIIHGCNWYNAQIVLRRSAKSRFLGDE